MDCKIIFSPQAISDLEAVVRYIARDDAIVAERVGNELIDRVEILAKHPLIGAHYPRRPGVHKLVSRPYIIFYRPRLAEGAVDILRYWHGAQADPNLL
jgi:plasmid stabilization system protein ParE